MITLTALYLWQTANIACYCDIAHIAVQIELWSSYRNYSGSAVSVLIANIAHYCDWYSTHSSPNCAMKLLAFFCNYSGSAVSVTDCETIHYKKCWKVGLWKYACDLAIKYAKYIVQMLICHSSPHLVWIIDEIMWINRLLKSYQEPSISVCVCVSLLSFAFSHISTTLLHYR